MFLIEHISGSVPEMAVTITTVHISSCNGL